MRGGRYRDRRPPFGRYRGDPNECSARGVPLPADFVGTHAQIDDVVAGREGCQFRVGDWHVSGPAKAGHYILRLTACYRLIFAQMSAARRPAASVVATRAGHDRVYPSEAHLRVASIP